ncbi:peptidase M23 [Streptomyces xantholiticus]
MSQDVAQVALQAAGVAKKGLMLKVSVAAGVLFLAGLLLMGMLMPIPAATASSCEDTGAGTGAVAPDSGNPPATSSLRKQQRAHAKTIDSVAERLRLPGKATLIALMTAMQESTLQNLDHGDRDSVGLFQQRPSQKWGTRAQIMNPQFAATSFFQGRGGNKGLVDIKNWQTRPPGDVAQDVQNSDHPELYAGHESAMRTLAKEAGIDLGRAGTGAGGSTPAADAAGDAPSTCEDKPPTGGGGTFTDGTATWELNNPRTVERAIIWARANAGVNSTSLWYQRCLAYTAIVYGWNFSGVDYAIDHYTVVPADMRHDGDRNPPPGALMYWDTGRRAGHIAVYLGNGQVASNDILRPNYIDIVDAGLFESKWGAKYIGWTPPYFPRAG